MILLEISLSFIVFTYFPFTPITNILEKEVAIKILMSLFSLAYKLEIIIFPVDIPLED